MSAKKSVEVLIGGKVFTLSGYEDEDYLQRVAAYINNKITEYNELDEFKRLSSDMKSTLIELNIADDYFKAREKIEKFEKDVASRDKEIYELKHNLITDQVKVETLEEQIDTLEKEKSELERLKSKLEASLEDALLGSLDEPDGNDGQGE